jgi:hypothetical protein
VANTALNLTGDDDLSTASAADGTFTLNAVPFGGDYCLSPARLADNPHLNGVSSTDLVFIRRHILGTVPLESPYKWLAADVNQSGAINSTDLVWIQRLILNTATNFPGGLWRFVPADYLFPNTNSPWSAPGFLCYTGLTATLSTQDFVAIKLGDVNDSWIAGAARPESDTTAITFSGESFAAPGPVVRLAWGQHIAPPGQTVRVGLRVHGFTRVTSAQFTLQWDPAVLRFSGLAETALRGLDLENLGLTHLPQGRLALAWYDPEGTGVTLADDAPALTLNFEAVGQAGQSTRLTLTDTPTRPEISVEAAAAGLSWGTGEVHLRGLLPLTSAQAVRNEDQFQLTVPSVPGQRYVLEFTDTLPATRWTALPTVEATTGWTRLSDPAATNHQRFYRVRVE